METTTSIQTHAIGREPALTTMAIGRLLLGIASLAAPRAFARAVGVSTVTPELTYMTRIYGARALAMGTAFLTSSQPERARWTRLSLAIDISDTATGIVHLLRRDSALRAIIAMIALTASYAVLGALHLISSNDEGRSR
ncbi:hypothetical protein [Mycolicibacterium sp. 624]|uniref:hypothetical protein n=2 Tax=unclassified Mycolicibacterium TaxID=2636767 RepID=UPI003394A1AA